MKNISWTQLNIILAITVGTALLLGIAGGVFYRSSGEAVSMADVEDINLAWIVETEEEYDSATDLPCSLDAESGTAVSISHFLPEEIGEDYGIAFRSFYNAVQVKVGDTILYQYGVDERRPFLSAPAPHWNFVPIDSRYGGQLLTITQISDYGSYSGLFDTVRGGSRSALLYQQWKENGWGLILSAVLLLLAGGLALLALGLKRYRKLDNRFRYFLLLAGIVTVWSITGCPLTGYYLNNGYFCWLLHILTRMLIPIAWLMFLRGFMQKPRLVMAVDAGILAAAVCYVAAVILQVLGLLEFPVTYDFLGVLYSIGFLLYTAITAIGWLGYGRKELRTMAIGNLLLAAAGIVNLFLRPNRLYQTEGAFWQISVMVYMFFLLAAVSAAVMEQMEQEVNSVKEAYAGQRAAAVAMMNPNFLFAALNSLLTMTKEGSRNVAKFVFAFSRYLRYNFDSVREDKLIPFETELKHIEAYLELQQLRMPELTVSIEDKLHDFPVPSRSIEAIVENAVKYGIGKNGNRGRVIVRSYERRDAYAIQIVDEGAGFDTDMLYRKQTPTSMLTVRERLEQSGGAAIEVTSKAQIGTIVTVKIPKKKGITNL